MDKCPCVLRVSRCAVTADLETVHTHTTSDSLISDRG